MYDCGSVEYGEFETLGQLECRMGYALSPFENRRLSPSNWSMSPYSIASRIPQSTSSGTPPLNFSTSLSGSNPSGVSRSINNAQPRFTNEPPGCGTNSTTERLGTLERYRQEGVNFVTGQKHLLTHQMLPAEQFGQFHAADSPHGGLQQFNHQRNLYSPHPSYQKSLASSSFFATPSEALEARLDAHANAPAIGSFTPKDGEWRLNLNGACPQKATCEDFGHVRHPPLQSKSRQQTEESLFSRGFKDQLPPTPNHTTKPVEITGMERIPAVEGKRFDPSARDVNYTNAQPQRQLGQGLMNFVDEEKVSSVVSQFNHPEEKSFEAQSRHREPGGAEKTQEVYPPTNSSGEAVFRAEVSRGFGPEESFTACHIRTMNEALSTRRNAISHIDWDSESFSGVSRGRPTSRAPRVMGTSRSSPQGSASRVQKRSLPVPPISTFPSAASAASPAADGYEEEHEKIPAEQFRREDLRRAGPCVNLGQASSFEDTKGTRPEASRKNISHQVCLDAQGPRRTADQQLLGETLYKQVHKLQPQLAGKITGMLMELKTIQVLRLVEDPVFLFRKVAEAYAVYEEYVKSDRSTKENLRQTLVPMVRELVGDEIGLLNAVVDVVIEMDHKAIFDLVVDEGALRRRVDEVVGGFGGEGLGRFGVDPLERTTSLGGMDLDGEEEDEDEDGELDEVDASSRKSSTSSEEDEQNCCDEEHKNLNQQDQQSPPRQSPPNNAEKDKHIPAATSTKHLQDLTPARKETGESIVHAQYVTNTIGEQDASLYGYEEPAYHENIVDAVFTIQAIKSNIETRDAFALPTPATWPTATQSPNNLPPSSPLVSARRETGWEHFQTKYHDDNYYVDVERKVEDREAKTGSRIRSLFSSENAIISDPFRLPSHQIQKSASDGPQPVDIFNARNFSPAVGAFACHQPSSRGTIGSPQLQLQLQHGRTSSIDFDFTFPDPKTDCLTKPCVIKTELDGFEMDSSLRYNGETGDWATNGGPKEWESEWEVLDGDEVMSNGKINKDGKDDRGKKGWLW